MVVIFCKCITRPHNNKLRIFFKIIYLYCTAVLTCKVCIERVHIGFIFTRKIFAPHFVARFPFIDGLDELIGELRLAAAFHDRCPEEADQEDDHDGAAEYGPPEPGFLLHEVHDAGFHRYSGER